ncbi:hypothetical protein DOTSEDRAFT_70236 [Dothistroma septosporum NZE10]|uniref:Uncharacterized protein n=1 Tax=Dothistroma septosporum (strain NZE10 / CBS 128990) TaxID=675120 RepID=N1PT97_DOTSN|nr:hypothetical protein DOTSEDRAFT_70236 [Dothistroma septosporum NZE10]
MVDTQDAKPSKSSFLKKSKWGKIFKEQDTNNGNTGAPYKLNEDVVDFLKPSTEKNVPKIDIALAKRWPEAHEVQRAAGGGSPSTAGGGRFVTKRVRKQGLTVGFVKTVPEIIGEGGDDAPDPPREISRTKAAVSRSTSERKPAEGQWPRSPPLVPPTRGMPPPFQVTQPDDDDFVPPPMRRANTSHNEFSPAVQKKYAPPAQETDSHKPSIGRIPTGLENHEPGLEHTTPLDTPIDTGRLDLFPDSSVQGRQERPRSRDRPTIDTHAAQRQLEPRALGEALSTRKNYGGLSPADAASPVAQKRREQSVSEGMAFRRASMLIRQDDDEANSPPRTSQGHSQPTEWRAPASSSQWPLTQQTEPSAASDYKTLFSPAGHHPDSAFSKQQSAPSIDTHEPGAFSPLSEDETPETATPTPNPFDDPKYIKRHSRDLVTEASQQSEPVSLRQMKKTGLRRSQQSSPAYQSHQRGDSGSQDRSYNSARVTGLRQPAAERPQILQRDSPMHHRLPSRDGVPIQEQEVSYRRPGQPAESRAIPSRAPPAPSNAHSMSVPQDSSRERSASPGAMRNRIFQSSAPTFDKPQFFAKPNVSSSSINRFSPSVPHSRAGSRDGHSPLPYKPAVSTHPQPPPLRWSQQYANEPSQSPQSPRTSGMGPTRGGPSSQSPPHASILSPKASPEDYFAAGAQPSRSHAANLRQEDASRPRPASAGSHQSVSRSSVSPQPPEHGNPAADAAFADFAGRVAHMKGVFSLTAEKELPRDRCTPNMWLRAGLWWYLKGKSGLEALLHQRRTDDRREYLTQAHVDLAKAWWILSDPLETYDSHGEIGQQNAGSDPAEAALERGVAHLRQHIKAISLSTSKAQLLPPTQSLIQGQDTRIWLEYPRFTSDAAAVLGGNASNSVLVEEADCVPNAYDMLPLSDTKDAFCYGRFPVEVYVNTDEAESDRVVLECMMTVMRGRRDYQTSIAIASQSQLVNIRVAPSRNEKRGLSWSDVSWKASSFGMMLNLPRSFDLSVRMQERDFRAVWNLSEYARKVEKSLRPEPDEKFIHQSRLAELQYADSSNSSAFPADKVKGCVALVFERTAEHRDGSGVRKVHRGHRLLLITDPGHKTLSAVSHDIGLRLPLYFEYLTGSSANGTTAMVIRVREETRQCRVLLVFPDAGSRQALYDVLNGLTVGHDEIIVGKAILTSLNIEPASQTEGFSQSAHPALADLQWQKLCVTNNQPEDPNTRILETVESENLRILARHATGCITDRLNLGKGEMLFRLPITDAPVIQMLREPQKDMTMSIDTRQSDQQVAQGIGQLSQIILEQQTIRTFSFASHQDLHTFQTAITGCTVRFEGLAATFAIARRRMVVPIYKKWEASNVRMQMVSKESVVNLVAFMDDFSHADSLCFQVKTTDTFELIKGDDKKKKWGVKLVDAKFSLPSQEKGEISEEGRLRRRFVNLEGLDYAEEHDDITIGFDTEKDRDRFAQALPAATSTSRGISLKRRI